MKTFILSAIAVVMLLVASMAHAVLPAAVTTAITDLSALAAEYGTGFIPLAVAVALAFIGIKWVKRFIGSSS